MDTFWTIDEGDGPDDGYEFSSLQELYEYFDEKLYWAVHDGSISGRNLGRHTFEADAVSGYHDDDGNFIELSREWFQCVFSG